MECMKCSRCGEQMQFATVPRNYALSIPFTSFTVELWNWNAKEWVCLVCPDISENKKYESIFDAGYEKGYERAHREVEHGPSPH